MINWLHKKYWRTILLFLWVLYRLSHRESVIHFVRRIPGSQITISPSTKLFDFVANITLDYWLSKNNPCWHRSVLTYAWMTRQQMEVRVFVGAGSNDNKWGLHIWVEDQAGNNLSDFIDDGVFKRIRKV